MPGVCTVLAYTVCLIFHPGCIDRGQMWKLHSNNVLCRLHHSVQVVPLGSSAAGVPCCCGSSSFCESLACFNFLRKRSLCCAFLTSWEVLVDHISCAERVTQRYLRFSAISTVSPCMWSGRCCFLTLDLLKSMTISFVSV